MQISRLNHISIHSTQTSLETQKRIVRYQRKMIPAEVQTMYELGDALFKVKFDNRFEFSTFNLVRPAI